MVFWKNNHLIYKIISSSWTQCMIILSLILLTSCGKKDFNITNLNGNQITAMGHGGMGISNTYPINTFESISSALANGADGTEIDVQMTADKVLVAFHDVELSQKTNLSGRINERSWAELQEAQYNFTPYSGYSIVSMDDLFTNLQNINTYTFAFDCKLFLVSNDDQPKMDFAMALVDLINKHNLENNTFIESTETDFLRLLTELNPDLRLFYYAVDMANGIENAMDLGLQGITISNKKVDQSEIQLAHDAGLQVALFNTQSKSDNIEAIEKNPDYIQSDRLKHLINILN